MGHAGAPDVHDQHGGGRIGIAPFYGLQKKVMFSINRTGSVTFHWEVSPSVTLGGVP